MSRALASVLVAFFLIVCAIPAAGQTPADQSTFTVQLQAAGGVTVPVWPDGFSYHYGTGYGMAGGAAAAVFSSVSLLLEAHYNHFSTDTPLQIEGGDAYTYGLNVGAHLFLPAAGRLSPYFILGAGPSVTGVQASSAGDEREEGASEVAATVLGGFGISLETTNQFDLFFEGRVNYQIRSAGDFIFALPRVGVAVDL